MPLKVAPMCSKAHGFDHPDQLMIPRRVVVCLACPATLFFNIIKFFSMKSNAFYGISKLFLKIFSDSSSKNINLIDGNQFLKFLKM